MAVGTLSSAIVRTVPALTVLVAMREKAVESTSEISVSVTFGPIIVLDVSDKVSESNLMSGALSSRLRRELPVTNKQITVILQLNDSTW